MAWRRRATFAAAVSATVAAVAILNRSSEAFEVAEGVTLVFPASAATVLAALFLGWWGVAAAFVGFFLAPWGLSSTLARAAFFAAAASIQGAIPAAAQLCPEGPTWKRLLRLAAMAAVINTLASSAAGVPMLAHLADLNGTEVAVAFTSWFLSDLMAIVLLAFPVLLLVRPRLLLEPLHERVFRSWLRSWRPHLVGVGALALGVVLVLKLGGGGVVSIHWLAPLLLIPVLVNAARGAVGGGLLTNGVVGIVYVGLVLHGATEPGGEAELFRELVSSYVNLVMFTAAATVAGLYSARSRSLLAELEEHRRLLQQSFERVVTALAAAIEAKDRSTEDHVQRTARHSVAVGHRLGIEGPRLELLRYAAILHDVGKLGVPEQILTKPGPLSPEERKLVERHVEIGVEIIRHVDILEPAIPFIRYHQERWDGATNGRFPGYFGLRGEEIPLEARIIAAVDAYDAMISNRPYRAAMSRQEAMDELEREAGKQFDPRVVNALIEVLRTRAAVEASDRWPVLGEVATEWL